MSSSSRTTAPAGAWMIQHRPVVGRLAATLVTAVAMVSLVGAAPALDADAAAPPAPARPSPARTLTSHSHAVLALGDSVPSGAACDCSPFPALYASLLARQTGGGVTVSDEGVSGLDTAGLLAQLEQPALQAAVRRSDVLLLTIGANDFADQHASVVGSACTRERGKDCVSDELVSMRSHLARVLAEIRSLRGRQPTSVLVTGYWNVFQDGQVARDATGASGLRASIGLTRRVNEAITSVSSSAGAHYVDLFAPFHRSGVDIDTLLAPDGDHPDKAGHLLIASVLLAVGLPRLS